MEPVIERKVRRPTMREMPTPEMPAAAEVVHATAMTASEDR